jgi:two-component system sensor histidine kinase KdpD
LNYYFTPPAHTLRVADASDIVALFVFLGIAVVVGSLFAGAVAERERTERRENDLRLVNRFATWLLRADLDGRTVGDIATTLVHAMGLRSCRISVRGFPELSRTASTPVADGDTSSTGQRLEVPISSGDEHLGEVVVEREARAFSGSDRSLLEATAGQLGLAIERSRLETEARAARTGAEISEILSGAVLLRHARPADTARVDQGGHHEPPGRGRGVRTPRRARSSSAPCSRRPTA